MKSTFIAFALIILTGIAIGFFIGSEIALTVTSSLVSVSENSFYFLVVTQILIVMTMCILPIVGMLLILIMGLPTWRQFLVLLIVSAFGIASTMTAIYFLHWAGPPLVVLLTVIIPMSVWGLHLLMRNKVTCDMGCSE